MKLNFTKTWGQFSIIVSAEVSEDQLQSLATEGALHLFERDPSGKVEQKVCGPELGWNMGERGVSYKRPSSFERRSFEYSEERAAKFKQVFETTPGNLGEDSKIDFTVISITKNEGSEAASAMVRATAFVRNLMASTEKELQMRGLFEMLGMVDSDTADFTQLVEFAHEKKIGIQSAKAGK